MSYEVALCACEVRFSCALPFFKVKKSMGISPLSHSDNSELIAPNIFVVGHTIFMLTRNGGAITCTVAIITLLRLLVLFVAIRIIIFAFSILIMLKWLIVTAYLIRNRPQLRLIYCNKTIRILKSHLRWLRINIILDLLTVILAYRPNQH